MFKHIVHANDGTENSFKGLDAALSLCRMCGSTLDVLIVEDLYPHTGSVYEIKREKAVADREAEALKRRITERASDQKVAVNVRIFTGPAVAFITEYVHECDADLLVIGASQHVSMIELVIGRRSDRIAHGAQCSVLIAR